MFQMGDQDFIARRQRLLHVALGHHVDGRCGARGEHDVVRRTGPDKSLDSGARAFVLLRGALTDLVHAPMNIARVHTVVLSHGLHDLPWLQRGGCIVQIHQWVVPMDQLPEGREVIAHGIHVKTHDHFLSMASKKSFNSVRR